MLQNVVSQLRGHSRSKSGARWIKSGATTFHSLLHHISAMISRWELCHVMYTGFYGCNRINDTEVFYAGTSEGTALTRTNPALPSLVEVLIQPLTCSPAILAAHMESCFRQRYWHAVAPLSAQRLWTPTNLHSSTRAFVSAWGCRITPSSCQPPVRKSTSAGSGWPGVACSTSALHCAWAWPLVTSPPEGISLLSACTPVTTNPPTCAGNGTVATCWTTWTATFPCPHYWTPPRWPLLHRSNGHCMVVWRTCAPGHIVVSMLVIKVVSSLFSCVHAQCLEFYLKHHTWTITSGANTGQLNCYFVSSF